MAQSSVSSASEQGADKQANPPSRSRATTPAPPTKTTTCNGTSMADNAGELLSPNKPGKSCSGTAINASARGLSIDPGLGSPKKKTAKDACEGQNCAAACEGTACKDTNSPTKKTSSPVKKTHQACSAKDEAKSHAKSTAVANTKVKAVTKLMPAEKKSTAAATVTTAPKAKRTTTSAGTPSKITKTAASTRPSRVRHAPARFDGSQVDMACAKPTKNTTTAAKPKAKAISKTNTNSTTPKKVSTATTTDDITTPRSTRARTRSMTPQTLSKTTSAKKATTPKKPASKTTKNAKTEANKNKVTKGKSAVGTGKKAVAKKGAAVKTGAKKATRAPRG